MHPATSPNPHPYKEFLPPQSNFVLIDLELLESLSSSLVLGHSEDVESDSLGKGSALANGDLVAVLDSESGGAVGSEVLVTFLVSAVFGDTDLLAQVAKRTV